MFSLVRRHLSVGSVLAFVALVFTMSGCGYALSSGNDLHGVAAKKKKSKVVVGPRGPQGKEGKQGPQGVPGEKGAQGNAGGEGKEGKEGKAGNEGKEGKAGKGVVVAEEPSGTAHCEGEGGASLEAEGSGVKHYACNGKEGSEGPPGPEGSISGVLPHGVTETGAWVVQVEPGKTQYLAPISFTAALSKGLEGSNIEFVKKGESAGPSGNCTGSAEDPTAPSGFLCVYAEAEQEVEVGFVFKSAGTFGVGASTAGAYLVLGTKEPEAAHIDSGTWAVTG